MAKNTTKIHIINQIQYFYRSNLSQNEMTISEQFHARSRLTVTDDDIPNVTYLDYSMQTTTTQKSTHTTKVPAKSHIYTKKKTGNIHQIRSISRVKCSQLKTKIKISLRLSLTSMLTFTHGSIRIPKMTIKPVQNNSDVSDHLILICPNINFEKKRKVVLCKLENFFFGKQYVITLPENYFYNLKGKRL